MDEVILNSGHSMPMAIFGTSRIPIPDTKSSVLLAVRSGYKHIDTASIYKNESEIGEALSELLTSKEKTRDQLFITTKAYMAKYRNIKDALKHSLNRLQLTYIDLYLLHWPFALEYDDSEPPILSAKLDRFPLHLVWAQMEALVDKGLARSIGVSNWTVALLNDMLGYARIPPAVNQIEINAYNKRSELVEFCLKNGVRPVGYRVIFRPLGNRFSDFQKCVLDDPVVQEISLKYGKSQAQILQAWCLSRGCAYISKTVNQSRMTENLSSLDIKLDQEDLNKISSIPDQGLYMECAKVFGIYIFK